MKANKRSEKAQNLINRLSTAFNVCSIEVRLTTLSQGINGTYWPAWKGRHFSSGFKVPFEFKERPAFIQLRPRADLETLVHEFAHHLDHTRGHGSNEPPLALPEVREFVAGKELSHTELRYNASDKVPNDWKF